MDRRGFLKSALAASLTPVTALAVEQTPFHDLLDLKTQKLYRHDPDKFMIAHFMTAQEIYEGCGALLNFTRYMLEDIHGGAQIEPLLIMPWLDDQQNPDRVENYHAAQKAGMTVLTGKLSNVLSAAGQYPDTGFLLEGDPPKVIDHSLNAYFLKPNGSLLIHYSLNINMAPEIQQILKRCNLIGGPNLCL